MPHLHRRMRRLTPKNKKKILKPENQPNFYEISKKYPLNTSQVKVDHDWNERTIPLNNVAPREIQHDILPMIPMKSNVDPFLIDRARFETCSTIEKMIEGIKSTDVKLARLDYLLLQLVLRRNKRQSLKIRCTVYPS